MMSNSQWCIEQHESTNHYYDTYIPYRFHLTMAHQVFDEFSGLFDTQEMFKFNADNNRHLKQDCDVAVWGHDLIEDARASYNDVKNRLGEHVADIIYAVSNEKGKNRKEKANDKYYEGIRDTPGAVFVKLCDRIANVRYSKLVKSRMFEMYKSENDHFIEQLGYWSKFPNHEFEPMFRSLNELFK